MGHLDFHAFESHNWTPPASFCVSFNCHNALILAVDVEGAFDFLGGGRGGEEEGGSRCILA